MTVVRPTLPAHYPRAHRRWVGWVALLMLGLLVWGAGLAALSGLTSVSSVWAEEPPAGGGGDPDAEVPPATGGGDPEEGLVLEPPPSLTGTIFGSSLDVAFSRLWEFAIVAAAVIFMVLILIGGMQYLTAMGNDEQSKRSKTLLLDAVIGLAIVIVAWPVGLYALRVFGIADKTFKGGASEVGDITPDVSDSGAGTTLTPTTPGTGADLKSSGGAGVTPSGSGASFGGGAGGPVGAGTASLLAAPLTVKLQDGAAGVKLQIVPSGDGVSLGSSGAAAGVTPDTAPREATTDKNGEAKVSGVPVGDVEIYENEGDGKKKLLGVTVVEPGKENAVTVDRQVKTVKLKITTVNNKTTVPIGGYVFQVRSNERLVKQDTTNSATGSVEVTLPAGMAISITSAANPTFSLYDGVVPSEDGQNWTVFVSQGVVGFHFLFTTPDGKPAAGRTVQIYTINDGYASAKLIKTATTGTDGRVTLANQLPGTQLWIKHNSLAVCSAQVPERNAESFTCELPAE